MLEDNQPGLDSLSGGTVQVKPTTAPGMPSVAGTVPLSPAQTAELVANMQKMMGERTGFLPTLMGGFKDALAVGQGAGATAERDRQKLLEQQQLLGMQNTIASYKASAEQNEISKKRFENLMSGTGTIPGVKGTPSQQSSILNDPDVKLQLANTQDWDYTTKEAILREAAKTHFGYSAKSQFDAPANKQEDTWFGPLNKTLHISTNEANAYKATGELPITVNEADRKAAKALWSQQNAAPTTTTAAPTMPGTAVKTATDLNIPIISGDRDIAKQTDLKQASLQPGYKGPPVAAPGTSQHEFGNAIDIEPKDYAAARAAGFIQPFPQKDPNHWELPGARTNAPAAVAKPTVTPPQTTIPGQRAELQATTAPVRPQFSGPEEEKQWVARENARQMAIIDALKAEKTRGAEKAGDRQAAMIDNAEKSRQMEDAADAIISIASNPKYQNITGIAKQGIISSFPSALANIQQFRGKSEKDAEEQAAKWLSSEEQSVRDILATQAAQLGVDYAAQIFHGARMGIGLENMAMRTKGVGPEYLPETNIINAKVIKEGAIFNRAKKQLWVDWKATHGGDSASYADFENDPTY